MKNKKLVYILIPGTLLVWGLIIYKIVAHTGGNDTTAFQPTPMENKMNTELLKDTFSIHPTYRDPFSGKPLKKNTTAVTTLPIIKKVEPLLITANWPEINYGGIVKNQQSSKQLVLVLINGQSTMMTVGQSVNNLLLTKVFRDSIEVQLGKEKKYIRK
jgi:hypothetical protein